MAPGRLALNPPLQTGQVRNPPLEAFSVVGVGSVAGATWEAVGHGKEGQRDGFMG